MSKKKGSGSTMTLKDFHGGSIPTDLRLPSAPGVITKPSDRPVFERQVSWGNPMGRSDQRPLRPGSAGSIRNFDDKTPFLSPSTHIGRNFDEDERTPLDGVSGPRRMVSDESTRQFPMHTELKPEYSSTGRLSSRPISSPSSHASSYAGRIAEASHVGGNNPHNYARTGSYSGRSSEPANVDVGGSRGHSSSSSGYPNAWGIRKEVVTAPEPVPATRPGPNDAFKLAHASALDKISSGRWQSKLGHPQTDVEVIKHTVVESEICPPAVDHFNNRGSYNAPNKVGEMVYQEAALVGHAERNLNVVDGTRGGGREFPTYEQPKSPMLLKAIDNNSPVYVDGSQADQSDHHFARSESRSPVPVDHSERPKLKLLPRSKPLESSGSFVDNKQVYQQPRNFDHMEIVHEADIVINPTRPALAGSEGGNQAVERPKLNIKPRSQPIEQFERNIDRSNTVFGAARPRELVLKERGVDDVAVSNQDRVQPPNRVKQDFPRTETAHQTHSTPIRYNERTENDNRLRKNDDRRDNNRVEAEKTDVQRRSWRNDNWRNNRETEQQHHQQQQRQQERPPSPETWRKPSEQPRPGSSGGPAPPRYGKGASAVELAQAFSRPASDPKLSERLPGQRPIVPGGGQVPFSRLMDQNSRPRINGY